jgi:hypothetical protein
VVDALGKPLTLLVGLLGDEPDLDLP